MDPSAFLCLYIVNEQSVDHSFEGFDATKEGDFAFGREKTGLDGIGGQFAEVFGGEGEVLASQAVFALEIAEEERGVVGVEGDEEAGVEIASEGVVFETEAAAGFEVGGDADFEGDLALGEDGEELGIVDGGEGVAEALGADVQGAPDAFGADGFAGMGSEAQTGGAGFGVEIAEGLSGGAALVSADADADDGRELGAHLGGFAEDAGGFVGAEVADGVEDPEEGEAELGFGAGAGALHAVKQRLEVAAAPVIDDADGDVDLGMNDALAGEALGHAPGDQLVILRGLEVLGDGFEGEQEAGEVGVVVKGAGLIEGERGSVVASAEFDEGFRRDGSLEMKVQLGFGKTADEVHRLGYRVQVAGCRGAVHCLLITVA